MVGVDAGPTVRNEMLCDVGAELDAEVLTQVF